VNDINVADRLETMNDAWNDAPELGTNSLPPDGNYQAKVERFDFIESKQSHNLTLITKFVVTNGEHAGREAPVFHDLEDPERLGWAKGHLSLLGLENVSPLSTLEERLAEVLDTPVEIRITSKEKDGKTYRNVYLNKRLGDPGSNGSGDDIPF
jgi:hypothetical protein